MASPVFCSHKKPCMNDIFSDTNEDFLLDASDRFFEWSLRVAIAKR